MKLKNVLCAALTASLLLTAGCSQKADNDCCTLYDAVNPEAVGNIGDVELVSGDMIAEFDIEGYGVIKAKLYPDIAPVGVDNFVKLAESGYYDGLTIHRVVENFMLQGGSLNGDGTGGEAADGGTFGIEPHQNMRHFYGALCYANAAGQNSTQFYIVNSKEPEDLTLYNIEEIQGMVNTYAANRDKCEQGSDYYNYFNTMAVYYSNLIEMLKTADEATIAKYKANGGTPSLDGGYTVFGQVFEGFEVIDSISVCDVQTNAGGEVSEPVQTITINSVTITEYTAE